MIIRVYTAAFAGWLAWQLPAVARACPMCFDGANSNSDAFVWGSLFLMFVPTVAIGSLLWWAYRRSRALELDPPPHAANTPAPARSTESGGNATSPAAPAAGLRVVR